MTTLEFTNINGVPLDINRMKSAAPKKVRKADAPGKYHKGYRVVGIPPGALAEAQKAHAVVVEMAARSAGKPIKPFDPESWRMTYRKKSIRAKAYELRAAADECAALAIKSGWTGVEVQALTNQ